MITTALSLLLASFMLTADDTPRELSWSDLIPEGAYEVDLPAPGFVQSHDMVAQQTGSAQTVKELNGIMVSMPGFMLPLDYTERGRVSAFLLVPYFGACIHVPPPPPNQIVYVETGDDPIDAKGLWDPVVVTGTMQTKMNINGLGDAAYTLKLSKIKPYDGL